MSHGRTVWSCCGAVLSQCRCMSPHGPDSVAQGPCPACVGHRPVPYLNYPRPIRPEPTPATPAAPGGEVELLERAFELIDWARAPDISDDYDRWEKWVNERGSWKADYRRLRDGK